MYEIKIPMFDFKDIMLVHLRYVIVKIVVMRTCPDANPIRKKGNICDNTITFLKQILSGKKGGTVTTLLTFLC